MPTQDKHPPPPTDAAALALLMRAYQGTLIALKSGQFSKKSAAKWLEECEAYLRQFEGGSKGADNA